MRSAVTKNEKSWLTDLEMRSAEQLHGKEFIEQGCLSASLVDLGAKVDSGSV